MTRILAIDPGNTDSGYALIDHDTRRPLDIGKVPNDQLLAYVARESFDHLAIEMIASYGMAVGREVFETCLWVGRYLQINADYLPAASTRLIYRREVKLHHCQSAKAKDPNITQALIDRFAPGQPNRGKGTKAEPGWFHGFRADIWQAYAVAVLAADQLHPTSTSPAVASTPTAGEALLRKAPF